MSDMLALSVREFIDATAARSPAPGGGAVAALCGALAAALGAMAMEYTVGKKAHAAHDAQIREALRQFGNASRMLQELIAEDIAAYEALSVLLKLPAETRAGHPDYAAAVVTAIRVPQTVAGFALNVLEHCHALPDRTARFLVSDLGVAAVYAHATVHASELNVRVNLSLLANPADSDTLRDEMTRLTAKADDLYTALRRRLFEIL